MSLIKHKSINKTKVYLRINKEIFQIMNLFPLETFRVPKINKIDFCKKDYYSLTRSFQCKNPRNLLIQVKQFQKNKN